MQNWDELRTAYQVARRGTVSGAAEVLGVHHATVIRHIDALEGSLGVKLFQRHARGYTPTEAGRDLLDIAQAADEQFAQLANRIKGQGETVQGELIVTSIAGLSDLLVPVLAGFQTAWPDVNIRFLSDTRLFRLDFGEAHVAIRVGTAPDDPDNVVQPLGRMQVGLYAARSYVEAHGMPSSEADLPRHRFVVADGEAVRAPYHRWLQGVVPDSALTFRATEPAALEQAVRNGAGLGFLQAHTAHDDPVLVQVLPPRPEWAAPFWIVTHVDLHRTRKVQALLAHLKESAKGWPYCD